MNNGVRLESQSWGADHAPELDYTGSSMVEVVKGANVSAMASVRWVV